MRNRIIAADRGSAKTEDYIKNQISNTYKIILDQSKLQKVFVFGSDGKTSIFFSKHVSSSQTTQYSLATRPAWSEQTQMFLTKIPQEVFPRKTLGTEHRVFLKQWQK